MNRPYVINLHLNITDAEFGAILATLDEAAERLASVGFSRHAGKVRSLSVKFRLACCEAEIAKILAGQQIPTRP